MPLKRCDGNGWKWGNSGHCYKGKDAKKKAIKQGVAIEGPDRFKRMAKKDPEITQADILIVYLDPDSL